MPGFNTITSDESIVFADNVSFDGTARGGKVTTDGQLLIGSTAAPHIKPGYITSSGGTIAVTNSSGGINLDLAGGGLAVDQINVDAHTFPGTDPVHPSATGNITITGAQVAAGVVGTNVIRSDSLAVNSMTIEIQRSTTAATTTVASNGVSHFDSAHFSVDANGFVTLTGTSNFHWNAITSNQTGAVANGYIVTNGALTISLPTGAALGDLFAVAIYAGTSWQITNATAQTVRVGNATTTSTVTSTDLGDSIELVCVAANTWIAKSVVGNLTLA